MFAIAPRFSDDYDDGSLFDDWTRPWPDTRLRPFSARNRNDASQLWSQLAALTESNVQETDKEWGCTLSVPQFKPEEIKVSVANNQVTVTAKHEEKKDKYGYVKREMTRAYSLPPTVDPQTVRSSLNDHGQLIIKAEKRAIEAPKDTVIPVEYKG